MDIYNHKSKHLTQTKYLLFVILSFILISITHNQYLDSKKIELIENNKNFNSIPIADLRNHEDNKIFLTEDGLNDNEKIFHLLNETRYDFPITNKWNRDLAIAYRDIAGIGYVSRESALAQINEILKGEKKDELKVGFFFRKFFEMGDWEHITTYTGKQDLNYFSYTILRNKRIGKIILTFSGTKGLKQLFTEYLKSDFETFYRYKEEKNSLKNFKIMKYFNNIYKSISNQLINDIKEVISDEISQYVFVGHSLGGAMASIAAYDMITQGIISVIKDKIQSPVLITYGQPRTGNYVFANELSKKIPIIYRHVNNYDAIVNMPDCYRIENYCMNEYNKSKIDLNFDDYDNIFIDENLFVGKNFPWHLNGLILNIDDENSLECLSNSETEKSTNQTQINTNDTKEIIKDVQGKCIVESKMRIAFHTIYYGYKVADIFKPEIFKYRLTEISCSMEDLFNFNFKIPFLPSIDSIKDYLLNKLPLPNEKENKIDFPLTFLEEQDKKEDIKVNEKIPLFSNNFNVCYYIMKIFRFFGKYE